MEGHFQAGDAAVGPAATKTESLSLRPAGSAQQVLAGEAGVKA